ncbi:MAG: hypothetical protein CMJ90_10970 [Planctomycetes bacterium]|nr:hypothetical protein [Planctomycetota bacterium]
MIDRRVALLLMLLASVAASQERRTLVVPRDFETVGAALEEAVEGDIVELQPGLYEENLSLKSGVTVRGRDAAKTIVRGAPTAPVVRAVDAEGARLENLTFEQAKQESSEDKVTAILISEGSVVLDGCAVWRASGFGVHIKGGEHRLEGCRVRECGREGLRVEDAKVTVRECHFSFNTGGGVHVRVKGRITGHDIRCEGNKEIGFRIAGEGSEGALTALDARANSIGLKVDSGARATVEKSVFIGNRTQGLYAHAAVSISVKDVECKGNQQAGILLAEGTRGEVVKVTCASNVGPGITIAHAGTKVTVTEGICRDNRSDGILLVKGCESTVLKSTCTHNEGSGITAADKGTKVVFTDNTCRENKRHGLAISKEAVGEMTKNLAEKNRMHGIGVLDKAEVTLVKNRCLENVSSGIQFWKGGHGRADTNTCDRNQQSGISFFGAGSKATLKRNTCRRNQAFGVNFLSGAEAFKVGRDNRLSSNRRGRVGR